MSFSIERGSMHASRFDHLVRGLAVRGTRRRALLTFLGIGAATTIDVSAERCRRAGQKCGKSSEPRGNRTKCCLGSQCRNGLCVCPRGLTACAGECVNTLNDPGNCGACATACPVETPVCYRGNCVACADDRQCSGDTPICNPDTGRCVMCASNDDCGGDTPFCNRKINTCVECRGNGDCPTGEACVSGRCGCTDACENAPCSLQCGSCGYCDDGYVCLNGKCGYPACNPDTCPNGCCDGYTCIPYADQDDTRCGSGGRGCNACADTATCVNGTCVDPTPPPPPSSCDRNTCPEGCCTTGGECIRFIDQSDSTCGTEGSTCGTCATGVTCIDGQCGGPCDHSTCPSGCCDGTICRTQSSATCGTQGGSCVDCGTDACINGACYVCDRDTCSNGCCRNNVCYRRRDQSNEICGTRGEACAVCDEGADCVRGACYTCNASTCPNGCCENNVCLPYGSQDEQTCGTAGAACAACPSGETCVVGGCHGCDQVTCPNGCCDAGECVAYDCQAIGRCGTAGAACVNCGDGACYLGVCSECNPTTCADGCCFTDTYTDPPSIYCQNVVGLVTSLEGALCGTGGGACVECQAPNPYCVNNVCVPCGPDNCEGCCRDGICHLWATEWCGPDSGAACTTNCAGDYCQSNSGICGACDATNCPNGCCSDGGFCFVEDYFDLCGTGGAACASCASGEACINQQCTICGPSTCPNGCCSDTYSDETGFACRTEPFTGGIKGFRRDSSYCGTGGAVCAPCAFGEICANGVCLCPPAD